MTIPSEYYKENWERTNDWLNKYAPTYVVKCVEELGIISNNLVEELLHNNKTMMKLETIMHRSAIITQEMEQEINNTKALCEELDGKQDAD